MSLPTKSLVALGFRLTQSSGLAWRLAIVVGELWLPTNHCLRAIGQLKWLSEIPNDDGSWSAILSYGHLSEADSTIVQALQWKHREV